MRPPPNPRNLPQKAAPEHIPATPLRGTAEKESRGKRRSGAEVAATIIGAASGVAMVAIAIWGVWVSADVPRYVDTTIAGPGQHNLDAVIVLLSWLVLFGPFLYFGIVLLRSTFSPEKRAWLVSLRVFTYIVGLRAAHEAQRRKFFSDAAANGGPQRLSEKPIDVSPISSRNDEAP
jgi:hypothetical protein